ncbi:two-component system response regulator RssB, partial [Salmonella enterica subsp. enterica serovar Anatum]|nr:two-component system response regulator RssB [Salmonella enterica subsp. enterica serovar Anatum]
LLSSSPWQPVIAQTTQHWAVIRSVSKTLGPDLRLAIVASDSAGDNGVLAALLLRALFNGLLQDQLGQQKHRLPELGALLKQVN